MDADLNAEDVSWMARLHTDEPVKPDVPAPVAERLVALGLAIRLVEGGLQLTALGRKKLYQHLRDRA